MRKDDLKKKIIEMINSADMHGYEVQKKLTSKGVRLNLSYLYRVLAEMEKEGYIEASREKSLLGPERKVYRLGERGSGELDEELKQAVGVIHDRYIEYLQKLPPQKSVIRKLLGLLDLHTNRSGRVLVVAPRVFYDWMITPLCEKTNGGEVYLVKPKSVRVNLECDRLVLLDTRMENILLRDNFIDTVRVHGEPENVTKAVEEFHRILRKNGRLIMVFPYFHSTREDYPITVGEFVEKVEHELSEEDRTTLDFSTTKTLLAHYFRKVTHYRLAHLTVLIASGKK